MNEQLAVASPRSPDPPTRKSNLAWVWVKQQAENDATRTAFGAWLALRLYCTLIGVVLYSVVPATFYHTALQTLFGERSAACPQYLAPGTGLNGALVDIWLRWDTPLVSRNRRSWI
jgi:hypothetical protein